MTYFKRGTFNLQNATFGSLFVSREVIKQKASKTRFFYFTIFDFLKKFFKKFQFFKLRTFSAVKYENVLYIRNGFFAFLLPFFELFAEISDAFKLPILREQLMLYKT